MRGLRPGGKSRGGERSVGLRINSKIKPKTPDELEDRSQKSN